MALIKCDECGASISDRALACPSCGNPLNMPRVAAVLPAPSTATTSSTRKSHGRKMAAWTVGLVVAIIIFMVYQSDYDGRTPSTAAAQAAAASPDVAQPVAEPAPAADVENKALPKVDPIKISAAKLYADYHANEVLADQKYKGKWLMVTGTVMEIGKDFTDSPYLRLGENNQFETVNGYFSKSHLAELAQIKKGVVVDITCRGNGMIIGSPALDCKDG